MICKLPLSQVVYEWVESISMKRNAESIADQRDDASLFFDLFFEQKAEDYWSSI